jgi:hypothetical protein
VLHDDRARTEVSRAIADQLVEQAKQVTTLDRASVTSAVSEALADPRIADNLLQVFSAEHALSLGIDDHRPTTIDTPALLAAVRDHLAGVDPSILALIPDTHPTPITLPKFRPPYAGTMLRTARTVTPWLAALAIGLLGVSLAIGDRRRTLRRFGTWGVLTGVGWVFGPFLLAKAAAHFLPRYQATVATVAHAWTRSITPAAIGLVVVGGIAIALMFVPGLAPSFDDPDARPAFGRRAPAAPAGWGTGPVARPPSGPTAPAAAAPAATGRPIHDTFVPSTATGTLPTTPWTAGPHAGTVAAAPWSASAPAASAWAAAPAAPGTPVTSAAAGTSAAGWSAGDGDQLWAATRPADEASAAWPAAVSAAPPAPAVDDPWSHFFPDGNAGPAIPG